MAPKTTETPQERIDHWLKIGGIPCQVTVQGKTVERQTDGQVFLLEYDKDERILRTLKSLGIGWGAAILSILIPLLHFVLVPLLLVGGVAWAIYTFQQKVVRLGGITTCPKCGTDFSIIAGSATWPIQDICSGCQESVEIRRNTAL